MYILDPKDYEEEYDTTLHDIKQFSLLENKRIGWNYCLDYLFVNRCFEEISKNVNISKLKIVDIGCGPGAIHGYLEHKYRCNIIGVDTRRWARDYVDYKCNVLSKKEILDDADIILSVSAIEHQTIEEYKEVIDVSLDKLKPNGYLIITSSISKQTNKTTDQINLNSSDLESIFKESVENAASYDEIYERYSQDRLIKPAFLARYKKTKFDTKFITYGIKQQKK